MTEEQRKEITRMVAIYVEAARQVDRAAAAQQEADYKLQNYLYGLINTAKEATKP